MCCLQSGNMTQVRYNLLSHLGLHLIQQDTLQALETLPGQYIRRCAYLFRELLIAFLPWLIHLQHKPLHLYQSNSRGPRAPACSLG